MVSPLPREPKKQNLSQPPLEYFHPLSLFSLQILTPGCESETRRDTCERPRGTASGHSANCRRGYALPWVAFNQVHLVPATLADAPSPNTFLFSFLGRVEAVIRRKLHASVWSPIAAGTEAPRTCAHHTLGHKHQESPQSNTFPPLRIRPSSPLPQIVVCRGRTKARPDYALRTRRDVDFLKGPTGRVAPPHRLNITVQAILTASTSPLSMCRMF